MILMERQNSSLKVVSYVAERGEKLIKEFKDENEEELKLNMRCVEDTRKFYPDFIKSTFAKSN